MKDKFNMSFGIGMPSIIIIFVSLLITTLATLALTTANSNYKLALKSAKYVQAYFNADNIANEQIKKVDEKINNGIILDSKIELNIPISDIQSLEVILEITNNNYSIKSYNVKITDAWNYEEYENNFSDIKTD